MIALGGGAVTSPVTRERLRDGASRCCSTCRRDGLAAGRGGGRRPAAGRGGARVRRAVEQRRPRYARGRRRAGRRRAAGGRRAAAGARSAGPARWPMLPRLVGDAARRADRGRRGAARWWGAAGAAGDDRLPGGEAAKTVAVAREAWTRLADRAGARGRGGGLGGGADDRRGRVRRRDVPARRAVDRGADHAGRAGGRGHRRQDRRSTCPVPRTTSARSTRPRAWWPIPVCSRRCPRGSGRPASPRSSRPALLAGGRLWELVRSWQPGTGEIAERGRAGAPLRRLQGARRGRGPDRAGPARRAQPGPHDRPRRSRRRPGSRHRPRRGGGGRAAAALRLSVRARAASTPREADVQGAAADARAAHRLPGVDPAAVREALRRDKKSVEAASVRAAGGRRQPVWGVRRGRRADRPPSGGRGPDGHQHHRHLHLMLRLAVAIPGLAPRLARDARRCQSRAVPDLHDAGGAPRARTRCRGLSTLGGHAGHGPERRQPEHARATRPGAVRRPDAAAAGDPDLRVGAGAEHVGPLLPDQPARARTWT